MSGTSDKHEESMRTDLSQQDIRSLIFHLLYAAESHEYTISLQSIVDSFNRAYKLNIPFDSEIVATAQAIIDKRDELDARIIPLLINWRFERIGVITKLILRFALWELYYSTTPANIVINEAIELAKCFAEKDAYKFVNGILDKATQKVE